MNKNFLSTLVLCLILSFSKMTNGLTCYSCSSCPNGKSNIDTITCSATDTHCFVGLRKDTSTIDQLCSTSTITGSQLSTYSSLKNCQSTDNCNIDTYSKPTLTTTKSTGVTNKIQSIFFIFSILIAIILAKLEFVSLDQYQF